MPKLKKTKKKPIKKVIKKKKVVTKKKAKKPALKKVAKKKVAVKKKTPPSKKKKVVTKKKAVTKKPAKKKAVTKKITKKAVTKAKPVKKTSTPKQVIKDKNPSMTNLKTPKAPSKPKAAPIKEDKKVVETESDVTPYDIQNDENYMTDEQLEHFRKILLRWKRQLMEEVDSTVGHMQKDGLSFPDPVDRASQEEGFNLELRTRDRERKLIKKIESALDNIETGDYGYCDDCGANIGIRRLEARPTANKCIDCKTYEEIREKQSGGH